MSLILYKTNSDGRFSPKGISCLPLSLLVANYADQELSNEDRELIKQYNTVEIYLLYEI